MAESSHEFYFAFCLVCIALHAAGEKLFATFFYGAWVFFYIFCICFWFEICIFSSASCFRGSFRFPFVCSLFFFFLQLAPATQLCKHTHKRTARMHTHMCKLQKLRSTGKSSTICPSMRVLYLRPCVRVCVCVWRSAIVCCETAACRAHFNIFFSRINYCACSCDWKIKKKPFSSDDFWMRYVWGRWEEMEKDAREEKDGKETRNSL